MDQKRTELQWIRKGQNYSKEKRTTHTAATMSSAYTPTHTQARLNLTRTEKSFTWKTSHEPAQVLELPNKCELIFTCAYERNKLRKICLIFGDFELNLHNDKESRSIGEKTR